MKTMNHFWFLVKTECTGPTVEARARSCTGAAVSPSCAVYGLSRSRSPGAWCTLPVEVLSPGLRLEWVFSDTLVTEISLLRLPPTGLDVVSSDSLRSVSVITTQLLRHLERGTDASAGP